MYFIDSGFDERSDSLMGKYRERLEILADILHVAGNGAKKTQIMYNANLSYSLLCKYLGEAVEADLIEPDGKRYVITEKGCDFLGNYDLYERRLEKLKDQLDLAEKEKSLLEMYSGANGALGGLKIRDLKNIIKPEIRSIVKPSSSMKGVILAAGDGSRIKSVTYDAFPKELLPIGNVPTIRFPLEALRLAGIKNFFVVVAPKTKHGIVDGLKSGERFNINVCYVVQENDGRLRGLGMAIQSTKNWIGKENFVVACGDTILCDFSATNPIDCLEPLLEIHRGTDSIATLLLHPTKSDPTRYGIVKFKDLKEENGVFSGEIDSTVEKPSLDLANSFKVNGFHYVIAGYYIFKPKIFSYIEKTEPGINGEIQITDAVELAMESGEKVYGVVHGKGKGKEITPCEYWDVGIPEDYKEANKQLGDLNLDKLLL